jgi:PAS domain S-box-containing protein
MTFYKSILNSLENPLFVRDSNNVYVYCNDAFANLLTLDKNQIIGKRIDEIFIENASDFLHADDFLKQFGQAPITEYFCPHHNRTFLISKSLLKSSEEYIIGIIFDITEIKQNEIEIVSKKHLDFLNKFEKIILLSGLLNNITHELAQPINAIKILVDTNIKYNKEFTYEQLIEDFHFISSQLTRIENIIQNILFLENSNYYQNEEKYSLHESTISAIQLFNSKISEFGIKITTDIPKEHYVKVSKYYLDYIISNLLLFSISDFENIHLNDKIISIYSKKYDDFISYEVKDNLTTQEKIVTNVFSHNFDNKYLTRGIIYATITHIFDKLRIKYEFSQTQSGRKLILKFPNN